MEKSKKQEKSVKISKTDIKKWIIKHAPVICISLAAFIILVVVLLFVFQAREELQQFTMESKELYTFAADHKLEYTGKLTLNHENNVTKMTYNGEEITFLSEPIYYKDQKKLVFPNKMSVVFPISNRNQYKINRFTVIDNEGVQPYAQNVDLNYGLTNAFIYDGYDVYVFVEAGTITYGDKTVEVSPMSFARCEYKGALSIYNFEKDEMIYEEMINDNVTATFENYSIDLSSDLLIVSEEPSLLTRSIDVQPMLSK